MHYYETVFIARQDLSNTQTSTLADRFVDIITKDGGKISRREYWGLRTLAYRIKKNRKGHYMLLNYEAKPETLNEIERQMRLSEDVIRYVSIRTEVLPKEASVMLKTQDERGGHRRDTGYSRSQRPQSRPSATTINKEA